MDNWLDEIELDKTLKTPLYQQLKNNILNLIWNNSIQSGDILPSEVNIANKLGISVSTVRQCMNQLASEGYIEKRRNRGTIVLNRKINLGYSDSISNFDERVKKLGLKPETKILTLKVDSPTEDDINNLQIPKDEKVITLERLRKINKKPIVLIKSVIPYEKNKYILSKDLNTESLYDLFENHPTSSLYKVQRRLYAKIANKNEAEILEVNPSTALLTVETLAYNSDNEIMEYSLSYSAEDQNEYTFEVYT